MKILFFLQPGTNSRDIFRDMITGFERAGAQPIIWELKPVWELYQRHAAQRAAMTNEIGSIVATLLKANECAFSVGMWANSLFSLPHARRDGKPVTFFDAIDEPHVCFWLDAPHWAHDGGMHEQFGSPLVSSPNVHHLINNDGLASEMSRVLGFSNTISQPYGINEQVFQPHNEPKQFDLVFGIGPGDAPPTELMKRELDSDEPNVRAIREEQAEKASRSLDKLASSVEETEIAPLRALMSKLLESQLEDQHTPILDRLDSIRQNDPSLSSAGRSLLASPKLFVDTCARLRQIEQWERAFVITYLSKHLNCATFGSGDLSSWGCAAQSLGSLEYADQSKAYSQAKLGLNVMRWQDDVGTNIKPLEISASGTACLMRRRAQLESLLIEGEQLVMFDHPAEAMEKSIKLLAEPDRLQSIAESACERTHREHTWTQRAGSLIQTMSERTGRFSPMN